MLEHANRMVGLDEDSDTAAIEEVTGKSGINPSTTPWCAAWAMNMLEMHGVLNLDGLSNRNYCPHRQELGREEGHLAGRWAVHAQGRGRHPVRLGQ